VSRWSRTSKLVVVLAVAAAPLAGCAAGGGGQVGPATSPSAASGADTAPSGSGSAATGSAAPSSVSIPPGVTDIPSPVTLTGDLVGGVEANCVLMRSGGKEYLLLGGDRAIIKPDKRVTVHGRVARGIMTTCQQGIPFQVSDAAPA
jgi:hypothetical protein